MKKKLIVDISMFILMLLEFSRGYLPLILHEVFGLIILALMIIHLILNKNYIRNIFKGKYNVKRIFMLIINLSFFMTFFLSIIFGILGSEYILKIFNIKSLYVLKLHKIFAYISLIILGLHIGINFKAMFGKIKLDKNVRIIIDIIIIVFGVYFFFKLNIIKHILGIYDFSLFNENIIINIIEYLSIILSISIITNLINKK